MSKNLLRAFKDLLKGAVIGCALFSCVNVSASDAQYGHVIEMWTKGVVFCNQSRVYTGRQNSLPIAQASINVWAPTGGVMPTGGYFLYTVVHNNSTGAAVKSDILWNPTPGNSFVKTVTATSISTSYAYYATGRTASWNGDEHINWTTSPTKPVQDFI